MKKTILAMTVMLMIGLTSVYANERGDINNLVAASFSKDFVSAQNISWSQQKNYSKATFTLNEQVMYAYYNQNGNLIAVSRNVLSDHLPIHLIADLKNNYNEYWISDLFEMATDDQTTYYVTLQNADETVILKSGNSDHWIVYKRERKNTF